MDRRRSLPSAALASALSLAVLLTPSAARAASSAAPPANPAGPARPAPASPASWPGYCAGSPPALVPPLDHGTLSSPDDHTDLVLGTPGLPDRAVRGTLIPSAIAAGNGWHHFQLTAWLPLQGSNTDMTDSPHEMKWIVVVSDGAGKSSPDDLLASRVQYLNGSVWSDLGQWAGAGTKLVTTALDIDNSSQTATARLRLRFKIDAGPSAGPVYVVEFGSYVDAEQGCTHYTFGANMITVGGSSRSLQYAGTGVVIVIVAGSAIALAVRRRKRS